MSKALAYTLAGVPLRHELRPVPITCTCEQWGASAVDEATAYRLHAEHAGEQADPSAHSPCPF